MKTISAFSVRPSELIIPRCELCIGKAWSYRKSSVAFGRTVLTDKKSRLFLHSLMRDRRRHAGVDDLLDYDALLLENFERRPLAVTHYKVDDLTSMRDIDDWSRGTTGSSLKGKVERQGRTRRRRTRAGTNSVQDLSQPMLEKKFLRHYSKSRRDRAKSTCVMTLQQIQ